MEIRKITKDGKVMTTKDGQEMVENRLEVGDRFIPQMNKVFDHSREHQGKTIHNFSVLVMLKDKDDVVQMGKDKDGHETAKIFVNLTPAQARSIQKKIDSGDDITQRMFNVYEYQSKDYGCQIGCGYDQEFSKPMSFEDFEGREE